MQTPTQPTPSKLDQHNQAAMERVLKATKTSSRYPKVSEQVETVEIGNFDRLFPFGYNPTINDKGWMVYRFHKGTHSTRLALARLGSNMAVFSNHELALSNKSDEDPKLFTYMGEDYISWVESSWVEPNYQNLTSVVKYARFTDGKFSDFAQPPLPYNDGTTTQKNYVLWGHGEQLMCLYQCHPTHRVHNLTTGDVYETDGPRWPYGDIRGGTVPLVYDGMLLRFFHSRINHEIGRPGFRYFIGYCLMQSSPPFAVTHVSKRPLIYGSEVSDIPVKERPIFFKPNVCFASGAVEKDGGFLVSLGENDSRILLCKIKPEQLKF